MIFKEPTVGNGSSSQEFESSLFPTLAVRRKLRPSSLHFGEAELFPLLVSVASCPHGPASVPPPPIVFSWLWKAYFFIDDFLGLRCHLQMLSHDIVSTSVSSRRIHISPPPLTTPASYSEGSLISPLITYVVLSHGLHKATVTWALAATSYVVPLVKPCSLLVYSHPRN